MPQRRTAKKDLRQSEKKHARNLKIKSSLKTALKDLKKALVGTDLAKTQEALKKAYEVFDKAAAKNFIHQNKASRKKSRLTKLVNKKSAKKA